MDADARHFFPATLFSHRQRKLSGSSAGYPLQDGGERKQSVTAVFRLCGGWRKEVRDSSISVTLAERLVGEEERGRRSVTLPWSGAWGEEGRKQPAVVICV